MYGSAAGMIERFGEVEMIRLTTPDGQDATAVDTDMVERALGEASALVDTYLRKRYRVPLDIAPAEVERATAMLARYDLSIGENRQPAEQTRLARKETIEWLEGIAAGKVLLDLAEVAPGDDSYATMRDRDQAFGSLFP